MAAARKRASTGHCRELLRRRALVLSERVATRLALTEPDIELEDDARHLLELVTTLTKRQAASEGSR